jgi:hypothetical protein
VINLKTFNLSRSVSLRIDFVDINGAETNSTPVFRPLITCDGQFHNYQNNYTCRWQSSSPTSQKVDSTRIIRMIAYLNAGPFGVSNKTDSIWIESIRFLTSPLTGIEQQEAPGIGIRLYPNPVTDRLIITSGDVIEQIEIFDIRGQQLIMISGINSTRKDILTADLPAGVYLVRSTSLAGEVTTGRFIKK